MGSAQESFSLVTAWTASSLACHFPGRFSTSVSAVDFVCADIIIRHFIRA